MNNFMWSIGVVLLAATAVNGVFSIKERDTKAIAAGMTIAAFILYMLSEFR